MSKKNKKTVTLVLVVLLCLVVTLLLAGLAMWRSEQLQGEGGTRPVASKKGTAAEYNFFWNGDETLLTREDVVVFDVRYDETDKEILCELSLLLADKMKKKGVQPIFLGAETDSELRAKLLLCEEMDLYIGLCVGSDDAEKLGTLCYYNDAYYVQEDHSVWLCDRLLQNVVTEISGRALGLETCDDRDLMVGLEVPAALLQIGYETHEKEGELLSHNEYRELIAAGIVKTVEEYYEGR